MSTLPPKKDSRVIAEVEAFIKDFHSGDIVISPNAREVWLTIPIESANKDSLLFREKTQKTCLSDLLAWAIASYLYLKDNQVGSQMKLDQAYECLDYIERARAYGLVIPQKLTSQLEQYKEENSRLKEQNDKLSRENANQKKLIEEMHKTIDTIGPKRLTRGQGK